MLGHLGAMLAHLGSMLAYLGPMLAHLDANLAQLGANMAQHRPNMASMSGSRRQKTLKKQWFLYGFHEIANFMKILIKPLFFQGFTGVGLLEIVAKSVIQGSSWLHVGGLGANLAPRWANMASRWANMGPR